MCIRDRAFRHGHDNLLTGKGRVDGLTGVGSDLFREAFTETIVAILRCEDVYKRQVQGCPVAYRTPNVSLPELIKTTKLV